MGSHPITFLWLWPATDHEPHCRHMPINNIWRRTESTPRSRWWRSHMQLHSTPVLITGWHFICRSSAVKRVCVCVCACVRVCYSAIQSLRLQVCSIKSVVSQLTSDCVLKSEHTQSKLQQYEKKHSPTHTHDEEEGFAQTTKSTAWKLIPLWCSEPAGLLDPIKPADNQSRPN